MIKTNALSRLAQASKLSELVKFDIAKAKAFATSLGLTGLTYSKPDYSYEDEALEFKLEADKVAHIAKIAEAFKKLNFKITYLVKTKTIFTAKHDKLGSFRVYSDTTPSKGILFFVSEYDLSKDKEFLELKELAKTYSVILGASIEGKTLSLEFKQGRYSTYVSVNLSNLKFKGTDNEGPLDVHLDSLKELKDAAKLFTCIDAVITKLGAN